MFKNMKTTILLNYMTNNSIMTTIPLLLKNGKNYKKILTGNGMNKLTTIICMMKIQKILMIITGEITMNGKMMNITDIMKMVNTILFTMKIMTKIKIMIGNMNGMKIITGKILNITKKEKEKKQ